VLLLQNTTDGDVYRFHRIRAIGDYGRFDANICAVTL
jgi:hypothetical protein